MPGDQQQYRKPTQGGVERHTHNVTRWRDADVVQR
jgi:hypothetical protein